jgi:hypothetical protein
MNFKQSKDHQELLDGGIYSRAGNFSNQQQYSRMEDTHEAVNEILSRALDSQADLERQQTDLRSFQSRLKRVLGMRE